MRTLVLGVILGAVMTGCCSAGPTSGLSPWPPGPDESTPVAAESENGDQTPRVVRRLIGEARSQVVKNRGMAAELADPRGRARAEDEARAIEQELDLLARRIDIADSDNLDDVMNRLRLLDTRIDLLNERLRTATLRTSAVVTD